MESARFNVKFNIEIEEIISLLLQLPDNEMQRILTAIERVKGFRLNPKLQAQQLKSNLDIDNEPIDLEEIGKNHAIDIQAIEGKWPGNESDEEFYEMLQALD